MVKLMRRTLKEHEQRIRVLEGFCRKVESVLVLSIEFNPFLECCRDETDREILKYLVTKQRATTSMMARAVNGLRRAKGLELLTRNACYFRVKHIEKRCAERDHPDLLKFNYKKNEEGLMRYWRIDPLIIDILRDQIKKLEMQESEGIIETPLL